MHNILLPLGILILLGAAFRRLRIGTLDADSVRHVINVLVLNIFLPALCIKIIYSSEITVETAIIPAAAASAIILSSLIAIAAYSLLGKALRLTQSEKGVLVVSSAFGNVAYLGIPVLTGLYGFEAARYALFYDLLASTPLLWILGAGIASHYGGNGRVRLIDSLKTIASLPPIWAIVAGVLLQQSDIMIPEFILAALGMLSALVVPLMTFSVGLALSLPKVAHAYAALPSIVIKLAISPLIAFGTAYSLGLRGNALSSCLLEGAMPTMVLSLLLASKFKLDTGMSAFMIVLTTFLSFLTLPLAAHITTLLRF